jgi:hypothetical protein
MGHRSGGVVFYTPGAWNHGITVGALLESIMTKQEIADLIVRHVS